MSKFNGHYKSFVLIALFVPLLLIILNQDTINHATAKPSDHKPINLATDDALKEIEYVADHPSHEDILRITETFMDLLIQDIDEDTYKVVNYQSKAELIAALEEITTQGIAETFVGAYYEEDDTGLYIIPTSTPPWFEAENGYDMVQLDKHTVNITQFNESDFYGDYLIELELTFENEWKITDVVFP